MEIKAARKLTDSRHLNLFEITYTNRRDEESLWTIASRESQPKCMTGRYDPPDAVVIVPFHNVMEKLVIIKEFRVPIGGFQYGFPAGLVDPGETIEQAVKRELKEETGLDLLNILKISPPVYSSSGMTDESVSMVYVDCNGVPSAEGNEVSELIETLFITPEEAGLLCGNSDVKVDVKTWLVINAFSESRKI